tara:strand:+ start:808 stop:1005 length:198 start_codon:yes stop_codon:yes gene_type:complete
MKEKAIEICRNLTQTLKKLKEAPKIIKSRSSAYEPTRASRRTLLKQLNSLKEKYDLTEEDLILKQ